MGPCSGGGGGIHSLASRVALSLLTVHKSYHFNKCSSNTFFLFFFFVGGGGGNSEVVFPSL